MYHLLLGRWAQAGVLVAWVGLQPWLAWPSLAPDTGHRLTLTLLALSLAALRLGERNDQTLPRAWIAWGLSLAGLIAWQSRDLLAHGEYFEWFRETAALSDGLLTLLAGLFGLWALRQLPLAWFRRLRWLALALCLAHWVAIWLRAPEVLAATDVSVPSKAAGLLGMDRFLGAWAVAWLPILFVWWPWAALLPLSLIAASGKLTALIGMLVAISGVRPRLLWGAIPIVLLLAVTMWEGRWMPERDGLYRQGQKVSQRTATWAKGLRVSLQKPLAGRGFSPMAERDLANDPAYQLPSIHSDWLAFAYRAGWLMTVWLGWLVWGLWREPPRTKEARALRAALGALAVMALGQSVLSHARIAGLALVFLAWWLREQEVGCER